jgi:hypothetical protein
VRRWPAVYLVDDEVPTSLFFLPQKSFNPACFVAGMIQGALEAQGFVSGQMGGAGGGGAGIVVSVGCRVPHSSVRSPCPRQSCEVEALEAEAKTPGAIRLPTAFKIKFADLALARDGAT